MTVGWRDSVGALAHGDGVPSARVLRRGAQRHLVRDGPHAVEADDGGQHDAGDGLSRPRAAARPR